MHLCPVRNESVCSTRRRDVDCFHPVTISPSKSAPLQSSEVTLPTFDLKAYARRGAEARVAELTAELNGIYNAFPDLRRGSARSATATVGDADDESRCRAQKAAVSKRMKAYWAARRGAKRAADSNTVISVSCSSEVMRWRERKLAEVARSIHRASERLWARVVQGENTTWLLRMSRRFNDSRLS